MNHYIYALVAHLDGASVVFYIGQTNDPQRRLGEHKHGAREGTERKYQFIRKLNKEAGCSWTLEVLHEITPAMLAEDVKYDDYEDYEIVRHTQLGYELTNMRAGSVLRQAELATLAKHGATLKSPKDVRALKKKLAAEEAVKTGAVQRICEMAAIQIERSRAEKAKKAERDSKRAAKRAAAEAERQQWLEAQRHLFDRERGL